MLDPTALDLLLGLLEAVKWLLALAHPKKPTLGAELESSHFSSE
jgi:hypothetical protein